MLLADRLRMGAAMHLASLLQRHKQKGPSSEEPLFWPPFGGDGADTRVTRTVDGKIIGRGSIQLLYLLK